MSDQEKNERDRTVKSDQRQDESSSNDSNRDMNPIRKYILFGILAVIIIVGGIFLWNWFQFSQSHESTRNAQIKGHVSPVIPRVDGYVAKVYVRDNEKVKKGQLLAVISKKPYQIDVRQAKAALAVAEAGEKGAKAHLKTVKVQTKQAKVQLDQAKTEYNRQKRLFEDHSTTRKKLDHAKYAFQLAQAGYEAALKQVQSARVNIQKAQAQIEKAKTVLANAQLRLTYTELTAPISGRVSKKSIEVGQYIRSGNQVMAIANASHVWVVANFKEGQIAHIKVGQPVKIEVDAYSDTTYQGTVQSIAGATGSVFALLPPDNASGNFVKVAQRIPVKITFNSADPRGPTGKYLKPGMNVVPTVDISKD